MSNSVQFIEGSDRKAPFHIPGVNKVERHFKKYDALLYDTVNEKFNSNAVWKAGYGVNIFSNKSLYLIDRKKYNNIKYE